MTRPDPTRPRPTRPRPTRDISKNFLTQSTRFERPPDPIRGSVRDPRRSPETTRNGSLINHLGKANGSTSITTPLTSSPYVALPTTIPYPSSPAGPLLVRAADASIAMYVLFSTILLPREKLSKKGGGGHGTPTRSNTPVRRRAIRLPIFPATPQTRDTSIHFFFVSPKRCTSQSTSVTAQAPGIHPDSKVRDSKHERPQHTHAAATAAATAGSI